VRRPTNSLTVVLFEQSTKQKMEDDLKEIKMEDNLKKMENHLQKMGGMEDDHKKEGEEKKDDVK
jgi:hypothetical protein